LGFSGSTVIPFSEAWWRCGFCIVRSTVKFRWSFGMQFTEKIQANWQKWYCFIMTMPGHPIQPEQPRRESKIYSGNFLNICVTAQTWHLITSNCLVHKKPPWWNTLRW
jgi:hypothetical protein